jgi:signal transduction histidine kinase
MLDHTNPAKHRFKYMLEGFDEDWIDARTTSEATYTNLAPGNYVFKVIGCNSDDVWSTEPTSIAITVLPPWYATWWFRILIMLVVIGFLYALYRYRLFKALEMERIRNRIAQDLHDEIGSTLSSISLYGAVMQRSADKFPQNINDILGKIIDSTSEMMESMNDMVWTIKADNDNFEHVVYRMRAFAGKMCEAKGIVLLFKADPKVEKLELGMERRKNIYLIFKEAVNNAVKYSDCDLLSIAIRQEDDQLMVYIKDDGIGFDPRAHQWQERPAGRQRPSRHANPCQRDECRVDH